MQLPPKTVERLSQYRRILLNVEKEFIYSHELAIKLQLTPVQIRRDIMLIGYSGTQRKGYFVKDLIERISEVLDDTTTTNVIIVGMGNLGRAITSYFNKKRTKIKITASFDIKEEKIGKTISNVQCYHIDDLQAKIKALNVSIAIMTLSPNVAQEMANKLVSYGIKGILNFTSIPLNTPKDIYVEDYDMVTLLEKVVYFVNKEK